MKDLDKMRVYINDIDNLYILENTVKRENFFMEWYEYDSEKDYIIYVLSDEALEFIIQYDDILYKLLSAMDVSHPVLDGQLTDLYFESDVYTLVDRIIWEELGEKENRK